MSNEISKAFNNKKALIACLMAGDPSIKDTEEFIVTLAENGVDLIEIGIPFSDPVAESEVIQNAMARALINKIDLDDIFDMAERMRKRTQVPITFMTYLNPLLSYGYDNFFKKCKETGIGGIAVADMPFEERGEIKEFTDKYGIDIITLITPASKERIETIAMPAKGFIYLVSSISASGEGARITADTKDVIKEIKKVTDIPVAVGSGIAEVSRQAKEIMEYADGIIVSTEIFKIIAEHGERAAPELAEYFSGLEKTIR